MSFTIALRKRCTMDVIQAWLNVAQPGLKVIDIITPDPCEITIVVDDEPEKVADAKTQ